MLALLYALSEREGISYFGARVEIERERHFGRFIEPTGEPVSGLGGTRNAGRATVPCGRRPRRTGSCWDAPGTLGSGARRGRAARRRWPSPSLCSAGPSGGAGAAAGGAGRPSSPGSRAADSSPTVPGACEQKSGL